MCRWESMKPGSNEFPRKLTNRVSEPHRLKISSVVPTAQISLPLMATA
jgi:hypothetical protein